MRPSPQDLAALCRDLRAAGVQVDVRHELRLREVFERAGPVTGARVRRLVQAVVLADPADRADVGDVLDGWLPTLADTTPPPGPVLVAEPVPGGAPPSREPPPKPPLPWDRIVGGLLAVLALVGVVVLAIPTDDPLPLPDRPDLSAADAGDLGPADAEVPTPTGSFPVPTLSAEAAQVIDWSPWFIFGIGLLGLALVGPQARRWRAYPEALPPADGEPPGPPPRPEVPPALASWSEPGDRRAMVWGVDHFETDDPSNRLDLRASIRATARAAFRPVVRYRRRRQPRTVWLWVDALADAQAEEVARQVLGDLRRANLDARLAWTFGSPERVVLDDHDQTELPSDGLDTPPDGAIVVWFTDGHGLSHVDDEAERRRALRALRAWPRLAIARCGPEAGDLAAHARHSGAALLTPERVAGWIGRGVTPRKLKVDLAVWQAAAALSPTPVDEATLLALGGQLGYPTPRALLDGLVADATAVGPRITWAPRVAAPRLSWLGQQPELGELVAFWLAHHAAPTDDDGRTARARAVDRALLTLWRDPEQASWDLAAHEGQADRVRAALRHLTPADGRPDDPAVTARLPWAWADLSPEARVRLSGLGLAGVPSGLRPVRPGRQWFGLGLSAALVALGLSMGVAQWLAMPDLEPREIGERPPGTALLHLGDGRWAAGVRAGKHAELTIRSRERLVVRWAGQQAPCAEAFGDGEIWRCVDAPSAKPPTDDGWPSQLLVAVSARPSDPAARRLAQRLLTLGAADAVVLRPWPWIVKGEKGLSQAGWAALARLPDVKERRQTVVVRAKTCEGLTTIDVPVPNCVAGDFDRLAAALGDTVRPLGDVWPGRAAEGAVMRGVADPGEQTTQADGQLELTVLGLPKGRTPALQIDGREVARGVRYAGPLPAGRHTLTVVDPASGRRLHEQAFVIRSGEPLTLAVAVKAPQADGSVIYFDYDSDQIRKSEAAKLNAAAARLIANPAERVIAEGHTDERGSMEMNISKGERLAGAAKRYLIKRGVARDRISTRSYGEERPVSKGSTEADWARNRRVELVWVEAKEEELPDPTLKIRLENGRGELVEVRLDGKRIYKGTPRGGKRGVDVYSGKVAPGPHQAQARVGGKVRVEDSVTLDAGDRHVVVLDLKATKARSSQERLEDPPRLRACSAADAALVRAAVVPVGAVEICLGPGGPGERKPDVVCVIDFQARPGVFTATARAGGRPDHATCDCIAKGAQQQLPPADVPACSGRFTVRWSPPAGQVARGEDGPAPKPAVRQKGSRLLLEGRVEFQPDKAALTPRSRGLLRQLADYLKAHPELGRVEVANHRDSRAPNQFGREITQLRADEVVRTLVKYGVSKKRLVPRGYGEDRPIAPNATAAGRAKNRRTEFRVLGAAGSKGRGTGPR